LLQLTSFRNLIRQKSIHIGDEIQRAILIGGVRYGPVQEGNANRSGAKKSWDELPFTGIEVDAIAEMMKENGSNPEVLKGKIPKKDFLVRAISKNKNLGVLHIATHGLFATVDLLNVKSKIKTNGANIELTQSGLVLADANILDPKDAILTAFEISEMDLSQTELVVLSACETGLGQVYENEGVYGMQRAFKIAGAEYLIMTLWQVPDRETRKFMTAFYKNYLKLNKTIPEAFYQTQKEMKEDLLDPLRWAGFVLLK